MTITLVARNGGPETMSAQCIARVPPGTYKKEPTRCSKPAREQVLGVALCRHHYHKSKRGGLAVWVPALERRTR